MPLLKDRLKGRRVILASRSPRRRELLAGAGIEFTVAEGYDADEAYPAGLPVGEVAGYLAELKSDSYPYPLADNELLVTADTVVILGDKVLGKPRDRTEAVEMLSALSGKRHTVVTGVVIRSRAARTGFSAASDVWFRVMRREEIEYYIDTYKPFDKAGAYGIQEWIGCAAVEKIEGSFFNVMGLPVQTLYVELEKFLGDH